MANKITESQVPNFEEILKQLDLIVSKMEDGDLTLEQALKHFEQGITLARQCQQSLRTAEQRVQELMIEDPSNQQDTNHDDNAIV
ncbi:MAG: exodeoxyribonuclease VII small subunit [Proteobacteria bacterium]|nr:exodeoxyribonuclease VII small subunit [Pseudomonadota bacterium]